ncbi:MAG: DNA-binding response regulator [Chloroflexi bacterium]|nr:DNA-binding response regulator [Chloroflexota bacterium]
MVSTGQLFHSPLISTLYFLPASLQVLRVSTSDIQRRLNRRFGGYTGRCLHRTLKLIYYKEDRMAEEKSIRVILADDHQVVRHGIQQILSKAGIDVVATAENGERALQIIVQHQPDVAVLDIQMPIYNGIEVARQVRAKALPVGLLILTAFDDDPFIMAALEAGVNGFILKTADMEEIVEAVRAVHEGQSVMDRNVIPKLMRAVTASHKPDIAYPALSERELEVLRVATRGLTNKAIGMLLDISDRTVQGHFRRIFEKLNAASRTEAVVKASQLGLLDLPSLDETSH